MERIEKVNKEAVEKLRDILDHKPVVYSDFQSYVRDAVKNKISIEKNRPLGVAILHFEPFTPALMSNKTYSQETHETFSDLVKKYGEAIVDDAVRQVAIEDRYDPAQRELDDALEKTLFPKSINVQKPSDRGALKR